MTEYERERYMIQVNDRVSTDFGCVLSETATFSGGDHNYDTTSLAGKIGELVSADKYVSNLEISCTLSVMDKMTMQRIRQIKNWVRSATTLKLSDSPEVFYKVLKTKAGDIERTCKAYGKFTVGFVCIPYEYRIDGQIEYTPGASFYNPFDKAQPIYEITGNGECTITVNGKEMTAIVENSLTIDTERLIAYTSTGAIKNTAVAGDYAGLELLPGDNSISVTSGFTLKLKPQWGYEI